MTIKYDATKGSEYNYEVGYLDGLKEAHRFSLSQQNTALADFLKKRIEEQRELIEEDFTEE